MAANGVPDRSTEGSKQLTSTPFTNGSKPDVAEMFKKMGDKLGWFQYNNLETAFRTLSKSSKKKSTKSKISAERSAKRKDKELLKGKLAKENPVLERDKERHKLSFNSSPLKENHSSNTSNEDFLPEQVLPRKSKACTDLTKEWKETKKNRKLTRISIIPSADAENISPGLPHQARYSISNADVGCPIQESTRIHSRQSIDQLLNNSEDSNQSSIKVGSQSELCGDLKYNITEEDSFKQLNIKEKCANFSDAEVTNSLSLLNINRSKQEETQLYVTASCEVFERDLPIQTGIGETEEKHNSDGMRSYSSAEELEDIQNISEGPVERTSYVEIVDASAQVDLKGETCLSSSKSDISDHLESASRSSQNDLERYSTESSKGDSFCEQIVKTTDVQSEEEDDQPQEDSDSSYIETADVSLQTSTISPSQKNTKQELESDVSYVEVEERSLQTSATHCSQENSYRSDFSVSKCNDEQISVTGENSDQSNTQSPVAASSVCHKKTAIACNTCFSSDEDTSCNNSSSFERKKVNLKDINWQVEQRNENSPFNKLIYNTEKGIRSKLKNCHELDDSLPDTQPSEGQSKPVMRFPRTKTTGPCEQTPSKITAQFAEFSSDSEIDELNIKDTGVDSFEGGLLSDSDVDLPDKRNPVKQKDISSNSDEFISQRKKPDYAQKIAHKIDQPHNNDHWRTPKHYRSDSSSEEDELESFFQKMKAPKPQEKTPERKKSLDDFIVDDDDMSSSDNDAEFYITTSSVFTTPHRKVEPIALYDSEDDIFKSDIRPIKRKTKEKSQKTPVSSRKRPGGWDEEDSGGQKYSFLKSLSSDTPGELGDREALRTTGSISTKLGSKQPCVEGIYFHAHEGPCLSPRYSMNFKKMKEDLTMRLFKIYNETVFDNQLPGDLQILWNNRLLKTAGYCVYKKSAKVHDSKSVRIELSTKVCDSAERVRDTLIHELCHAAVWLLHGKNDGHGPYWRIWAKKANLTHPEIPVIARCHSYSISTKYTYQCVKCGYSIGRHSKSLDTSRKVCGFCHGEFVLINNQQLSRGSGSTPATPRTPNKFAMYVKENYGSMKEKDKDLKHGEIMKLLGKQFAEKNKISS